MEGLTVRIKSLRHTRDLSLNPECTIADLLRLLEVPDYMTVLSQGQILRGDQSLESAGIATGALLFVVSPTPKPCELLIRLRREGKNFPVICRESATASNVKQNCYKLFGLHSDAIRVIYQGSELFDSTVLTDYITEKSPIFTIENVQKLEFSEEKFPIIVKVFTGRDYSIVVTAKTSIAEVNQLIQQQVGFAMEGLKLLYAGHCLNEQETIGQLGMREGSIVHIIIRLS
jgi:hypothetical protein